MRRAIVLVLDSCGCGGAEDAAAYGDEGADTLGNTARVAGGLDLPNLQRLGLGNLTDIEGVAPVAQTAGAFGRMRERSAGKDTTTGHWEIAGLLTDKPFAVYATGFPQQLIDAFCSTTGRGVLGNTAASGTDIIEELGPAQERSGDWIVYTSVDSVFQIAAHEQTIPLKELYAACEIARRLCDPYRIGRVIARPFVGTPGAYERTYNRHDYSMPPPSDTLLDLLRAQQVPVVGVGKISDIFSCRGIDESIRTAGNDDGMKKAIARWTTLEHGLVFVNLIDFDSSYGHRRDPEGFAAALRSFDAALAGLTEQIGPDDLLIITADHGNDPTFSGTDHTREHVPLLAFGPKSLVNTDLGTRDGFFDIAASMASWLGIDWPLRGTSFVQ